MGENLSSFNPAQTGQGAIENRNTAGIVAPPTTPENDIFGGFSNAIKGDVAGKQTAQERTLAMDKQQKVKEAFTEAKDIFQQMDTQDMDMGTASAKLMGVSTKLAMNGYAEEAKQVTAMSENMQKHYETQQKFLMKESERKMKFIPVKQALESFPPDWIAKKGWTVANTKADETFNETPYMTQARFKLLQQAYHDETDAKRIGATGKSEKLKAILALNKSQSEELQTVVNNMNKWRGAYEITNASADAKRLIEAGLNYDFVVNLVGQWTEPTAWENVYSAVAGLKKPDITPRHSEYELFGANIQKYKDLSKANEPSQKGLLRYVQGTYFDDDEVPAPASAPAGKPEAKKKETPAPVVGKPQKYKYYEYKGKNYGYMPMYDKVKKENPNLTDEQIAKKIETTYGKLF